MQTAETSLSAFLVENKGLLLELALLEGFEFSVRQSLSSVTVRCELPNGHVRYIVFDDHRVENPHGGKPHVCNQWYKAIGAPISYTMGNEIKDEDFLQRVLQATAVMCLTQSKAYDEMKVGIFS